MRLKPFTTDYLEAGCDEAGRGCLAGPVVAAAVILPKGYKNKLINDSKKINESTRILLEKDIKQNALAWAVGVANVREIEKINILNASILAMHRAIDKLKTIPKHLAIDGNKFKPYPEINHSCIIKGDAKFMNIAAASIIAKTHRDHLMCELDKGFPSYEWKTNKGYPTKKHREAILKNGYCEHHRRTFRLLPKQIKLAI